MFLDKASGLNIELRVKLRYVFNIGLCGIHRRSYMSAHVLLILLIEFGKRDQMRGLPSILSLFPTSDLRPYCLQYGLPTNMYMYR